MGKKFKGPELGGGRTTTSSDIRLADLAEKNHNSLDDVTPSQHHVKTVAGDLNLADLAEKNHTSLDNVLANQHHAKTVAGELNLADLLEKNHASLTGVLADQHPNTKVRTIRVDESGIGSPYRLLEYDNSTGEIHYVLKPHRFPYPDYMSDFMDYSTGQTRTFTHGLFSGPWALIKLEAEQIGEETLGRHNLGNGSLDFRNNPTGYYYHNLTSTQISVTRSNYDIYAHRINLMMWGFEFP